MSRYALASDKAKAARGLFPLPLSAGMTTSARRLANVGLLMTGLKEMLVSARAFEAARRSGRSKARMKRSMVPGTHDQSLGRVVAARVSAYDANATGFPEASTSLRSSSSACSR